MGATAKDVVAGSRAENHARLKAPAATALAVKPGAGNSTCNVPASVYVMAVVDNDDIAE